MDKPRNGMLRLASALTPDGWRDDVTIALDADGVILSVTTDEASPEATRIAGVAVPGTPNLHSHAFQRGMAGLAERAGQTEDSFWTWREIMYRFAAAVDPDDVEALAALAYAEMLEGGFTHVGEFHYLHHAPDGSPYADPAEMALRHVAAAQATGIGLTLLPVFYAHGGFGGAPAGPGQRRFLNDLHQFARLCESARPAALANSRNRFGIAPHSLRAASLHEIRALALAFPEGPIHIHVAEQVREVEDCLAAHGARPVALLAGTVEISPRWCLIHATHADETERAAMIAAGAVAGLCPITEANLGDGVFAAADFQARGGRFGVGSDSNLRIDLAEELRLLDDGQRLSTRRRNPLARRGASSGRTLFDAALAGGAAALDLGPVGLAPGASCDLVVLDADAMAFAARSGDALLDAWIYVAGRPAVREVWVAGRRVVENGRHVARTAIEARARETLTKVLG